MWGKYSFSFVSIKSTPVIRVLESFICTPSCLLWYSGNQSAQSSQTWQPNEWLVNHQQKMVWLRPLEVQGWFYPSQLSGIRSAAKFRKPPLDHSHHESISEHLQVSPNLLSSSWPALEAGTPTSSYSRGGAYNSSCRMASSSLLVLTSMAGKLKPHKLAVIWDPQRNWIQMLIPSPTPQNNNLALFIKSSIFLNFYFTY